MILKETKLYNGTVYLHDENNSLRKVLKYNSFTGLKEYEIYYDENGGSSPKDVRW